MTKIHDWTWAYWSNADGSREMVNGDDVEPSDFPEEVLASYENERGDTVSYEFAPEDVEGEYVVRLNGRIPEDIGLEGNNFDGEEFESLVFDTREEAREAAADLRRMIRPVDEDELEEMSWDEMVEMAKPYGLSQNDGKEAVREALT
ncbi:MAG: hypothetical protein ABEH81_01545 [Halopenitus sp.]